MHGSALVRYQVYLSPGAAASLHCKSCLYEQLLFVRRQFESVDLGHLDALPRCILVSCGFGLLVLAVCVLDEKFCA